YDRWSSHQINNLLFQWTLLNIVASLFLVSLATLNFLFVAKAIRSNRAQLGKYQRRAEGFFAGSWILLMLEPTLILVTVGVYFAAAVALALWVVTIFAFGSGLREAS